MKKYFLGVLFISVITLSVFSQKKDKAVYEDYHNAFYKQIETSLDGESKVKSKKRFVMDQSNVDAPTMEEFTTVWCNNPISQGRTGTCWCFSTSSFYESEIHRISQKQVDLSELYTVYWEYVEKAREYVQTRGKSFFGEGSETNAVARMMAKYGIVPQELYKGKEDTAHHDHKEMFHEMQSYLESVKETSAWNEALVLETIQSILNHYLGVPPTKVTADGKDMTPVEYMNYVGIVPGDYVNFMSLMKYPYYKNAEYDVPDNWWNSEDYYNVPLDDFINVVKTSISNGYSISIGGDVSESGYNPLTDLVMVPSYDIPSEYIDENARQLRFNNGSTTDDHAIHIIGYAKKKNGWWFLIKDSGSGARNGKNKGYYFYHEDYIKLKIMTMTVHKNAVPDLLGKMKMD